MKYCSQCGKEVHEKAVVCVSCGCSLEATPNSAASQIVINNTNTNSSIIGGKLKNKWVSFFLCLFLGFFGIHRFYEGKIGTGILWLCTGGMFGIGWLIDLITILCKPNPYLVI